MAALEEEPARRLRAEDYADAEEERENDGERVRNPPFGAVLGQAPRADTDTVRDEDAEGDHELVRAHEPVAKSMRQIRRSGLNVYSSPTRTHVPRISFGEISLWYSGTTADKAPTPRPAMMRPCRWERETSQLPPGSERPVPHGCEPYNHELVLQISKADQHAFACARQQNRTNPG